MLGSYKNSLKPNPAPHQASISLCQISHSNRFRNHAQDICQNFHLNAAFETRAITGLNMHDLDDILLIELGEIKPRRIGFRCWVPATIRRF
jgi:hypothetical protein